MAPLSMVISLDPVLLRVGPGAVRWFGAFGLAGLALGVWLTLRAARRRGVPRAVVLDALVWAVPVAVLGARLVHVLGWWDYYLTHASEVWRLDLYGLSLWGGLVMGGLIVSARVRRTAIERGSVFDAAVPGLAIGIVLGRLGAFLEGFGQGGVTDLPWATRYSHPLAATPDFGTSRHPAQMYDGLMCLLLLALLVGLARASPAAWPAGARMAMFAGLYGLARVGLGLVGLDPPFVFGLQIEQLLALVVVVVAAAQGMRLLVTARARLGPGERSPPRPDTLAA